MTIAETIVIQLDGKAHALAADSTLATLIATLGHAPQDVATAVNGEFVPRTLRAARVMQPGDCVLLFQPIVGG